MKPEDYPAGRFDNMPTPALIVRNAKPREWSGFHKTLDEIRKYPERDEWERKPVRPEL